MPTLSLPRWVPVAFASALLVPLSVRAAEPENAAPPAGDPAGFGTIERKDPRFDKLVPPGAKIEKLADGFKWAEGPVWSSDGGFLLFSDVPANTIFRWKQGEGAKEYIHPSGYTGLEPRGGEPGSNGLTRDSQGRLILCEHGDRRVTRVEKDNTKTVLADKFEGKRFNSPNDVIADSHDNVFFTDPPYGLEKNIDDPKKELPFQGVFRVSKEGKLSLVIKDLSRPNGLALSPDEKTLYVAVSDPEKAVFMAYDLGAGGTVSNGRVFKDVTALTPGRKGLPDGMKVDTAGNVWGTGPGGIFVFAPDGTHLGTLSPADPPTANCAWGEDGSVLYITSNHTICRVKTGASGRVPGTSGPSEKPH